MLTLSPSTTDKNRFTLSGAAFPNRPIMIRPEPVAPVIEKSAMKGVGERCVKRYWGEEMTKEAGGE